MITEWRVHGFKSATEPTKIRMPGMTVLVGANSSGKSAIIQSMLLMAQSVGARVTGRQVSINGRWTRLGDFAEIRSTGNDGLIRLGVTIDASELVRITRRDRIQGGQPYLAYVADKISSLDYDVGIGEAREAISRSPLAPLIADVKVVVAGQEASEVHCVAANVSRSDRLTELIPNTSQRLKNQALAVGLDYEVRSVTNAYEERGQTEFGMKIVGAIIGGWLPSDFVYTYDAVREEATRVARLILQNRLDKSAGDPLGGIGSRVSDVIRKNLLSAAQRIPESIREVVNNQIKSAPDFNSLVAMLPLLVSVAGQAGVQTAALQSDLEEAIVSGRDPMPSLSRLSAKPGAQVVLDMQFGKLFRYLGPLRDEPKSLYPVAIGVDSDDVGVHGEFTASVLDLHKDSPIRWISPADYEAQGAAAALSTTSLANAVQDWLSWMGIVEKLETSNLPGGLGHRVQVSPSGNPGAMRGLVHVGVGVSQVLPVLVMCLVSPPGSILVLEQPELHLNPAVQSRLGDFLLSQMLVGKRLLIETHSDYLVTRLRLRCAEAPGDSLSSKLVVYGVEAGPKGSRYQELSISRFGVPVGQWPRGFIDILPAESSAIMGAALHKKAQENLKS